MFADVGYEETETQGLGWISGEVSKIDNQNGKFKLPHIGWNELNIVKTVKSLKILRINPTCILFIAMNLFQKIKM
jgi:glutamine amidotransferase